MKCWMKKRLPCKTLHSCLTFFHDTLVLDIPIGVIGSWCNLPTCKHAMQFRKSNGMKVSSAGGDPHLCIAVRCCEDRPISCPHYAWHAMSKFDGGPCQARRTPSTRQSDKVQRWHHPELHCLLIAPAFPHAYACRVTTTYSSAAPVIFFFSSSTSWISSCLLLCRVLAQSWELAMYKHAFNLDMMLTERLSEVFAAKCQCLVYGIPWRANTGTQTKMYILDQQAQVVLVPAVTRRQGG